jgi:putrescine transport system ATP-binding protein
MPLIKAHAPETFARGAACCFAIRPEKVSISGEKPADADNALEGRVLDIGYLGNMSTYHVELGNGQVVKAQVANQRRLARRAFTWDDHVWISFTVTAGLVLAQ